MELVVRSFRNSFFAVDRVNGHRVGVASARAGNMLGGGDWGKDRLVPDMIRSFAVGKPVVLRNPHAKRPWQFVLETLRGYLLLAQALYEDPAHYAGAWNFGPGAADVRSVEWIVERLAAAWGAEAKWNIQPGSHPQEAQMLRLDCSKAAMELSWSPGARSLQRFGNDRGLVPRFLCREKRCGNICAADRHISRQAKAKWEILSPAFRGA